MPVQQSFTASRNATWAPTLVYPYQGAQLPLAGGHIAMQLRLYPGAIGDALLTINPIAFTDQLQSGTPGGGDEMRLLTLSPSVTPAQLEALPAGAEPGDSVALGFDIRLTYADGSAELLSTGSFIVSPGVTTV